jgi:hypothetical protein
MEAMSMGREELLEGWCAGSESAEPREKQQVHGLQETFSREASHKGHKIGTKDNVNKDRRYAMRKEKTIANCKEGGFNNNNNSN